MFKKIYCKDCRFRFAFSFCRSNPFPKYRSANWLKPGGRTLTQEFCSDKNESNDCSEYKKKWWKFWVK